MVARSRFILPAASAKMRILRTLSTSLSATASLSSGSAQTKRSSPGPIRPTTRPSISTRASATRCNRAITGPKRCFPDASAQGDAGEFALADLDHEGPRRQAQAPVADDGAVHPDAAALDQAHRFAGRWRQARLLQERADGQGSTFQRDRLDLVGDTSAGPQVEVGLAAVGRRGTV